MLEALGNSVECLVCMDIMSGQIRQCQGGHSMCVNCANRITSCPLCKTTITSTRNYKLEDLMANLKQFETKYNIFEKKSKSNPTESFATYNQNTSIELESWNTMTLIDQITTNRFDYQLLSYNGGEELFWYKRKINVKEQEVSWLLQYLEPKAKPGNYYYEFTLSKSPTKILKIGEKCDSEIRNMDDLILAGKCITLSFKTLKNYRREDRKVYFRFEIIVIPEGSEQKICRPLIPGKHMHSMHLTTKTYQNFCRNRIPRINNIKNLHNGLMGVTNLLPSMPGQNNTQVLDLTTNPNPSARINYPGNHETAPVCLFGLVNDMGTKTAQSVIQRLLRASESPLRTFRPSMVADSGTQNQPLELVVTNRRNLQETRPKRLKLHLVEPEEVIDLTD